MVLPARVKKPKDKAKVENAVLLINRWILARLRKRQFFSLNELNRAIAELLEMLNQRPFKKLPGCRRSQFEQIDLLALSPLPEMPYRLHCWKKARVNIDYHIKLEGHYYSVPYALAGAKVDVRYTDFIVEILCKNKRVASHQRNDTRAQFTTLRTHPEINYTIFLNLRGLFEEKRSIAPYKLSKLFMDNSLVHFKNPAKEKSLAGRDSVNVK